MYISTLHPCLKLRSCGNVEEKFGIGAIFQYTDDRIREKRRNADMQALSMLTNKVGCRH